ncbi:MFS transporter [Alteraurantiacibacter buctensis]|uniref:MFS transporter n=1 Tax=Alteraurantiacibacter buctensis TaxID=1503981 RepID=A0A844Z622_9SPHN|nr:MFS transporter [Alteraurantiacibacter buctensis]MXO73253.1 MFS transporter [Alteraurantiacibacter buctensis]
MAAPAPDNDVTVPGWTPSYEWKAVLLLTLGFGLVGLDRWIIAPLAPAMIGDLGMTPQDVNNLVAVLGVAWGVSAVLMGGLSDRIGRRRVLIPSIVFFSLMSGFSGMATGFLALFAVRAMMGVAEGAFCPTSFAATAEASKPSRRGFNQGLQQATFALFGLGFGPIIATQLLQHVGWREVFLLVAIPGLIVALLLWLVIREPRFIAEKAARAADAEPVPAASLGELFAHRNVGLGMASLLCAMCGIFVLSANIPLYLTESLGLSPTDMGLVTSAIGFGGFAGQWGLPALSDIFGRRPMAVAGFVLGAVFLWFFMQVGAEPGMLFVLLFLSCAFSFGLLALITGPIATEAAPPGRISTTAGIIIGSGEIFGGGLALVVAGAVIAAYGIDSMLYLALGGLLAGCVLTPFLRETAPRRTGR